MGEDLVFLLEHKPGLLEDRSRVIPGSQRDISYVSYVPVYVRM